jgi:hypothetical protein
MAQKDLELRPVMTRIPEGLRRRLEREAKFRGRSMNAEIVKRLQESFDIPDQAGAIASDVASEISSELDDVSWGLNEIKSQVRAILSHLGLPDPVEEARARKAKPATRAELERALQAIERAGFKIARLPEAGPSAASETKDGEKK